ncbi:MAG: hypothetical protein ACI4IJ_09300, partial [Acutalibacteraceae bacterium]
MKKVLNAHKTSKLSIFKEGMRQTKIFGIAYTVICAIVSIILALEEYPYKDSYKQHSVVASRLPGSTNDLTEMLIIASAIFIFVTSIQLFNFLRSHKARDFYCSTPHSICTIWLSFVTSIMTWAAIGAVAAGIIQLPFVIVSDVKYFQTWLLTLIGILVIDLLICGVMSLASALTGRIIPMLITAASIFALPVTIYYLSIAAYDSFFNQFYFTVAEQYNSNKLITLFKPYALDLNFNATEFISSAPFIFVWSLFGVIYLAVAVLFMTMRTGDAAGKPFVNKAAHLISLLSVSLNLTSLAAVWLTYEIARDILWTDVEYIVDEIVIKSIASLLAVLVSFWAANVILTFDIKKSHRMFKYLPIPVVLCAAVVGIGFAVSNAEFHITPTADEIKSFTLVRNDYLNDDLAVYRMRDSYGRLITQDYEFTDKKVINYVANAIDGFVKHYDKNFRGARSGDSNNWVSYEKIDIKINLEDGRSITRSIAFNNKFLETLVSAIENDSEYMK